MRINSHGALLGGALLLAGAALGVVLLRSAGGLAPPFTGRPADKGPAVSTSGAEWFVDRASDAGLDFVHFNGMSGERYYAEHMGPGVALFDYDNDDDLDVFLPQGQMLGAGRKLGHALFPPTGPLPLKGRLFRNDLELHADGTRVFRFTDVTDKSGINADRYGMGVATGDFDNDGCVDLYVTALGRNQLFRNNCNGTFTDVSKASRTDDSGWSSSAAFVDYDRDGWLDLFVAHYLNYSAESNVRCFGVNGVVDYCPPARVFGTAQSPLSQQPRRDLYRCHGLDRSLARVRPRPRRRDRRFQRRRVDRPLRGQ